MVASRIVATTYSHPALLLIFNPEDHASGLETDRWVSEAQYMDTGAQEAQQKQVPAGYRGQQLL
jgi:hypothetical protein